MEASGEEGAGSGERGAGSGERGAGSRERGAGSGKGGGSERSEVTSERVARSGDGDAANSKSAEWYARERERGSRTNERERKGCGEHTEKGRCSGDNEDVKGVGGERARKERTWARSGWRRRSGGTGKGRQDGNGVRGQWRAAEMRRGRRRGSEDTEIKGRCDGRRIWGEISVEDAEENNIGVNQRWQDIPGPLLSVQGHWNRTSGAWEKCGMLKPLFSLGGSKPTKWQAGLPGLGRHPNPSPSSIQAILRWCKPLLQAKKVTLKPELRTTHWGS
ncbi:hypothetical protein B0H11DRAFT_1937440 [Mycena galericulata]|nr:hypothetical protein B0H11DRAFT_1937440 [Mycena galericulata]